jgi:ATP-dependent helicase HepA
MRRFQEGQRWISESEPELGVAVVVSTKSGGIDLLFRASNTLRRYAVESAPIRRVEFREGDTIKIHTGESVKVDSVDTEGKLLIYVSGDRRIPETELCDTLSFSKPEERLLAGQVDEPTVFDLRYETLRRRHQIRHSAVRGLMGARIDLIPHQLYIANEVASRLVPRVLLADEVGLGKTIEACLILHRLFRSGRAQRILILVPEPLVYQWFVELLRRFNLMASIFDEERCVSLDVNGENPFLDDQLILCPISLLSENAKRGQQALEAGWDLVVVDEAHHLEWAPESSSAEYQIVESLAAKTPGVILLTATPEQLGAEGHFARLRLLDPDRYSDFAAYQAGRSEYRETAQLAGKLIGAKKLTAADRKKLKGWIDFEDKDSDEALVNKLLDQHGTGRVMFRNTRLAMKGFPKRKVHLEALKAADLSDERDADDKDGTRSYDLDGDLRVEWLLKFLQKKPDAKVLLIARTREKILALDAALRDRANIKIALFHEELSLLQRDRNAAWFAEEGGARVLLCSEIGSEGRNFQFAHHLVLFDLPENPELLEQRIGRLDRIGQKETISIHVPYPKGSHLEVLARWYHDGLNAFEKSLEGGREILSRFGKQLRAVINGDAKGFEPLVAETEKAHAAIAKELEEGQDRLLQMNSCRTDVAARIVEQIAASDRDVSLDNYLMRVFDHFGVHAEELSSRTWLVLPARLTTEAFPGLPEQGLTLTADRAKALSREEIGFLTWDHPMVTGAIDLLLGTEQGNSSFAASKGGAQQTIFLETIFVVEPVAPGALHADRFLPPTPVRIIVDPKGDLSEPLEGPLTQSSIFPLLDNARIRNKLIPSMLEKAREHAATRATTLREESVKAMRTLLKGEVSRLRELQKVNDHVTDDEITQMEAQVAQLEACLGEAPVRLDSIRIVWQVPE